MDNNNTTKKIFRSEHYIQTECIAWYRNNYERFGKGVIIPVPNELAAKRKDVVICKGASDTIIIHGSEVLFVEFKTAHNKQLSHQLEFQSLVTKLGYHYYLIRSIEQFKEVIL